MMYTLHYDSPLGGILLAADEVGLTGLWFEGAKYFAVLTTPMETRPPDRPLIMSRVATQSAIAFSMRSLSNNTASPASLSVMPFALRCRSGSEAQL